MRIVIDTNVIMSGLFFSGLPKTFLDFVFASDTIKAIATADIMAEYIKNDIKMALKTARRTPNKRLTDIAGLFEIIPSKSNVKISRDPTDDKFLACAIDGKCKYIVSGDKDLLDLEAYGNVEIVTVREFMDEYNAAK